MSLRSQKPFATCVMGSVCARLLTGYKGRRNEPSATFGV
ncbi:MAG: hypothetical protein AVDCRST_MAG86-1096 [uncultured Truepera sp.]|uniref:Uncharacterized protein n=1 Tax=uncultured Truepera sp. TaxID=543023 RepID=A0A6J4V1T2_9DEIN|nr:MAG: hypothetical protein AVDCRST_MAG86-1096 [uncultured Truepera sp.]